MVSESKSSEQLHEQLNLECEHEDQDPMLVEQQTRGNSPIALGPQMEPIPWGEAPVLGMVFQSADQAYDFYNAYARSVGFSVRKKRTYYSRTNRRLMKMELCCSKEGLREEHPRGEPKNPRPPTRSGCEALLVISLQGDGEYLVKTFKEEHNHELATRSEVHKLRSQRKILHSQAGVIDSMHTPGIESTRIFPYMHAESGGSQIQNFTRSGGRARGAAAPPQNLKSIKKNKKILPKNTLLVRFAPPRFFFSAPSRPCPPSTKILAQPLMGRDCDNYVQRKPRKILNKGDAEVLMNYFMNMQANNSSFFYSIQMDEDNHLASCFWCDAKSRMDYSFFGDVLWFDTTYKTNGYDMPYASFVGVNHHNQSIFFGAALLFDETTETFVWLFNSFLQAMNGKQPKTILTDQAEAIGNAIRQVLPNTSHRLCLWHIYQNAAKHLFHVFNKSTSFATGFKKCIYDNDTEEEFQSDWKMLLEKYNLVGNKWLEGLYQVREKWALIYGREHFCAGMTSFQRSESMNRSLKKYFRSHLALQEFLARYEDAVKERRDQEICEDRNSRKRTPLLMSRWVVEEQAAKTYTRAIFVIFQEQMKECFGLFQELVGEDGTVFTYKVICYDGMGGRTVTFDSSDNTIKCSCKMFEFTGILCSHALKIAHSRQLLDLPSQYFLHRWTKDATCGVIVDERKLIEVDCEPSLTSRHSELSHIALSLVAKGATTVNSCSLAKRKLMQVLQEIDFSLQVDQDQSKHVDDIGHENDGNVDEVSVMDQANMLITLRDPPHKRVKESGKFRGALEKATKKNKIQEKSNKERIGTEGQSGDDLNVGNTSVHNESVARIETLYEPSSTTELPIYPVRPSNMPQNPQATQYEFPRASNFQDLNSCPVGPLNMQRMPCIYPYNHTQGQVWPMDEAASNYGIDSTQSSQEMRKHGW